MVLTGPLIKYIKASRHVQSAVKSGIDSLQSGLGLQESSRLNSADLFARDVASVLDELNLAYQRLALVIVFGIHVPILFPLAVASTATNLVAVLDCIKYELVTADALDAQMNPLTEMLLVQGPSSPILNAIFFSYLFVSWFSWDCELNCHWIIHCWPLVYVAALIVLRWRYIQATDEPFWWFISRRYGKKKHLGKHVKANKDGLT